MTDLSKIDVLKAQLTMSGDEQPSSGLERADLHNVCHGQALHNHIGRRLRTVFPAPEEQDDAFVSLLQQISSRHS